MTAPRLVDPLDDLPSYASTWDYGDLSSPAEPVLYISESSPSTLDPTPATSARPRRIVFVNGVVVGIGLVAMLWWFSMTSTDAGLGTAGIPIQAVVMALLVLAGVCAYVLAVLREDP